MFLLAKWDFTWLSQPTGKTFSSEIKATLLFAFTLMQLMIFLYAPFIKNVSMLTKWRFVYLFSVSSEGGFWTACAFKQEGIEESIWKQILEFLRNKNQFSFSNLSLSWICETKKQSGK